MGNLLDKSTSKYILNQENYEYLEHQMLEFSGIPIEKFKFSNVKVGEFEKEDITLRTI